MNSRFGYCGIFLAIALTLGCGGGVKNQDLASIDGEAVTADDFHNYLEIKPQVKVNTNSGIVDARVAETLGYQALEDLLKQKAVLHLAKDEGVYPTDADITNEIEFEKKRNPNFLHDAQTAGLTVDQIKQQLSIQLAVEKILTKGINITAQDIDQYIKDNPDQFRDPEKADLDWIVVNSEEEKKQVDADLLSGQRFSAVAARYSKADNAKLAQGRYPINVMSQLAPDLRELISKTPELKATDWIKKPPVWAKWYVEKKTPAKERPIDATLREVVRRQLAVQKGQAATDLDKRIAEKLNQSKIDIKSPLYKQLWQQMIENMRTKMGTPSGPSGVAPTTPATK